MRSNHWPTLLIALVLGTAAIPLPAPAQILDAWRLTGPGRDHFSLIHDSTHASQGRYSLCLQADQLLADSVWAASEGVINIRPLQGGHLRLTAFLRTERATGATFWARVDGEKEGRYVTWGFDTMSDRQIVGTTPWKQYELVLPAPQGARMVVLGTLLRGTGRVWVDQIELAAVGEEVALTNISEVRVRDVPYREPPHLQDPVVEVSFEQE